MTENSHKVTAAIGLPIATVVGFTAIAFGAPAVHAGPAGAFPMFSAAVQAAQSAYDNDLHIDSAFEAADLQPALYGTARTGVAIALPGRANSGGAAPTLMVPGVDPSLPWWLTKTALNASLK